MSLQISSSICCYSSVRDTRVFNVARAASSARLPSKLGNAFATGSPLLNQRASNRTSHMKNSRSLVVKCEQSTKEGGGVDVWLGRVAMIGFAAAIGVEIGTGKGLLENFGLTSPLPTVALAVTVLVGVLTAVFIFQSSSDN